MFSKVPVANRGEIAVCVTRACEGLGVRAVAVYSEADKYGGHARYASEAYNIGPVHAVDPYFDHESVIEATRKADADAIHPGYGLLAENATFARKVERSEFTWVDPSTDAMERFDEKTRARVFMQDADVPVVPGTTEPADSAADVKTVADEFGYPVAIKAEGGGGGRGLKVVHFEDGVDEQFETVEREGEAYFDNAFVYVKKYLEAPCHIEVRTLADEHGNVRHLGECDCSLQRRHQRVIEEAPSPALPDDLCERIGEAARRGARIADYINAGAVEFLVEDGESYLMEVNTHIQAEHAVTEEVTDLDVMKRQLRVAVGEELDFLQDDVDIGGYSMELHTNAEAPEKEFVPATGTLATCDPPGGIGVRMDDIARQGDEIGGDYDLVIAKLIVIASDHEEVFARAERALAEFDIEGSRTVTPSHRLMLTDEAFCEGSHMTEYLDEVLDPDRIQTAIERWSLEAVADDDDDDEVTEHTFTIEVNDKRFEVSLEERGTPAIPVGDALMGGSNSSGPCKRRDGGDNDSQQIIEGDGESATAEMQGTILSVEIGEGGEVEPGDIVCILEVMKVENDMVIERGGTISWALVSEGDSVDMGDVLLVLE